MKKIGSISIGLLVLHLTFLMLCAKTSLATEVSLDFEDITEVAGENWTET